MLLAFTFILLAIGIGILVSVYSIFFPFIKNLGEIGNYNTAYYAAISSVERGELVLKNRGPGFEGTGGFLGGTGRGPQSDNKTGAFGFVNFDPNGMRWTIKSRTQNIPSAGEGNTEYLLADTTSVDYNMLNYSAAEKIILSYDNTSPSNPEQYYTGGENTTYYHGTLQGTLRLPPKVLSGFNNELLCDTCDLDGDGLGDDIIADWSLEGYKGGMYFKIVPNMEVLYYGSGTYPNYAKDTAIRESIINNTGNLDFRNNNFNPISTSSEPTGHVVIANNPSSINDYFSNILLLPTYTGLALNLGLINLLKTSSNNIYPFLEYQFTASTGISDRFYTIQGTARVGDYEVKVVVKKPTSQGSIAGSFTVIF